MRARVTVYPRREILDPQGKAIGKALRRVGFDQVTEVRAGKSFELELETGNPEQAEILLREMCEKLLANTVVEEFEIHLEAASTTG